MKIETLADLYVEQLQDMASAEMQLTRALPGMISAASHRRLRDVFAGHLEVTREHLDRVTRLIVDLEGRPERRRCEALAGLIKEGAEMIGEAADDTVRDAGLVVAAQRIEHYEIASYGCLRTFATLLGHCTHAELLARTLGEEREADTILTMLATSIINVEAMS